ncbi:unnamed protein product [Debaryomyces tyrocola]|nr:unnamed protein product [Debaryomyces tyrocola]
MHTFILVNMN